MITRTLSIMTVIAGLTITAPLMASPAPPAGGYDFKKADHLEHALSTATAMHQKGEMSDQQYESALKILNHSADANLAKTPEEREEHRQALITETSQPPPGPGEAPSSHP